MSIEPQERLSGSLWLRLPDWKHDTMFGKVITIAIVVAIIAAVGIFAAIILTPRPAEQFTEFYVLCADGTSNPTCYPNRLNVSQSATVIVGVVSHEPVTTNYTIRVDIVRVQVVRNATCSCNQTVEENRTVQAWFNLTLGQGSYWIHDYTFSIGGIGMWKVQFSLFANRDFRTAYREVHTFVVVS